jgi:hypothetical protein
MFTLYRSAGTIPRPRAYPRGQATGDKKVVGRQYLKRQATTLLKFAQTTSDPQVAAALVEKAADLKAQVERVPDPSPRAPDVELPTP